MVVPWVLICFFVWWMGVFGWAGVSYSKRLFGSSGRARTDNPSVNSYGSCHTAISYEVLCSNKVNWLMGCLGKVHCSPVRRIAMVFWVGHKKGTISRTLLSTSPVVPGGGSAEGSVGPNGPARRTSAYLGSWRARRLQRRTSRCR
jgi:hypothetical protein